VTLYHLLTHFPGALSDASTSRYRRRVWVLGSTAVLAFSALILAFSSNVAKAMLFLFDSDWKNHDKVA
jgi:solute carrier family 45 protein 1/2/4